MAPSPLPDVIGRLCWSYLINIHESFCTLLAKTKTNLSSIASPFVTSSAFLHHWIHAFGLACLIDLLDMPSPFSMNRSALHFCMTSTSSMDRVALHFDWRHLPIADNFQPHLACSGTLKDMFRFDSMSAAWQIFHGREVTLSFSTNGFHLIKKTWITQLLSFRFAPEHPNQEIVS